MKVKRYTMTCYKTHGHLLGEDPSGYIVQSSDYDTLLMQNNNLKNENTNLRKEIEELKKVASKSPSKSNSKKKTTSNSKYAIKVPKDEEIPTKDSDWMFVKDLTTGDVLLYDTKEEAEHNASMYGINQVVRL